MEEREPIGIKFSTVLIIIAIVVIIAVGGLIYLNSINNNEKQTSANTYSNEIETEDLENNIDETETEIYEENEITTDIETSNKNLEQEAKETNNTEILVIEDNTASEQLQNEVTLNNMTELEKSAFNDKFIKYEGLVKGRMVKSLINDAIETNSNYGGASVKINGIIPKEIKNVDDNTTYIVELEYESGLVKNIKVKNK